MTAPGIGTRINDAIPWVFWLVVYPASVAYFITILVITFV
jgi:hypothetical protein